MYGPGHPPQPTPMPPRRLPSRAWMVSMRVLFVVLSVGSIGLLLWAPLLRLAIVRRRTSDWWLTGAGFVFICVLLPIIGRDGSNADANGIDFVLIPMLFLAMLGAPVYSPLPWADPKLVDEVMETVLQPTVDELRRRG
ncbi:hypothetical protein ACWD7T_22550, partial [Streptomyces sp. 900116325]